MGGGGQSVVNSHRSVVGVSFAEKIDRAYRYRYRKSFGETLQFIACRCPTPSSSMKREFDCEEGEGTVGKGIKSIDYRNEPSLCERDTGTH